VLPFEGDTTLSTIISKAILLAGDDRITDESILRQTPQELMLRARGDGRSPAIRSGGGRVQSCTRRGRRRAVLHLPPAKSGRSDGCMRTQLTAEILEVPVVS
jgi:hypothetical protein